MSSVHSQEELSKVDDPKPNGKGVAFWLSIIAIVVSTFVSALDLTAVSTALPTITAALNGSDNFVWIGSAFALSSTAVLPLSGKIADIFGRKPTMLLSIAIFIVGSAIAGAAQNMDMLIAGRTIQGIGGGAILNLSDIIVSDLVPLSERGLFQGMIALTWAFASAVGPPIGGAFAEKASWRWIFYINLPLTGLAFLLVFFFLSVKTPEGSISEKMKRVDWTGNLIIIAGTTLAVVGLTFGGIRFPWSSAQVLAPLIIGMALVFGFILYEAKIPNEPTIPWEVLNNRTTFSGLMSTLIHGITSISQIYYLPVFFQACLGASPIRSGVDIFPTALIIAPFALVSGILIQVLNKYRPSNIAGWLLSIIGFGLLSLLRADSSTGKWVGYQIIAAAGTGMLYGATVFPILAPLPVSRTAAALGLFSFLRAFAQTWGITISSTILQNELKKKLPAEFISQLPSGLDIAYASIPYIEQLQEPLKSEVRTAFALSMSTIWKTMIGISGLGVLTLLLLKEIPMNTETDENFGLDEKQRRKQIDEEKATSEVTVNIVANQ